MKWRVTHADGFSERLLYYVLQGEDDIVELKASWFDINNTRISWEDNWCSIFSIDDTPLRAFLPKLRLLNKRYDYPVDDMGSESLAVEIDGEKLQCTVTGGGFVLNEHPELETLFDQFMDFQKQVLKHIENNFPG